MTNDATQPPQLRYAYLKTNHAVEELCRAMEHPDDMPDGGADAYVAHFVRLVGDSPALLLSIHFYPEDDAMVRIGNIEARSYYWFSRCLRPFGPIATRPAGTFVRRAIVSLKILAALVSFRPDRIICWAHSFPLWAAYLASRICRAPFVYTRHNRVIWDTQPWYLRITDAIDRWIMRHASGVIAHGPYLRQQLLEIGVKPEKLFEFNWGFQHMSEQRASTILTDLSESGTKSIILFIGRVEQSKGVFDLLAACSEQLRKNSAVRLVYAGDGSDIGMLRSRVHASGVEGSVSFLGRVSHKDLGPIIRQARMVVTPTQSRFPEGRCMVVMESIVMGTPVVAPNWGPFPYLIKHGHNGLLYEKDSLTDLRAKIQSLLDDDRLYDRLCRGARERGAGLGTPQLRFIQAVQAAFASSEIKPTTSGQ